MAVEQRSLCHTGRSEVSPSNACSEIFRFAQNDIVRGLSFFGQALNNTSERSEVSLSNAVLSFFTSVQNDKT